MFPKTQWVYSFPNEVSQSLLSLAEGNTLVASIYQHCGIQSAEDLLALQKSLQETTSPFELPDIEKGVQRILTAVENQEIIAVWGDFDADGQTSTSILVGALRELSANVIYHIPVRGPESHGINLPNLQKLFDQNIHILLTCDTGIREFEAALACKQAGVDMIITDHHTPAEEIPDAFAVISGQLLPENHLLHDLCGAGCAYKLTEALFIKSGQEEKKEMFIDLAAIGTIADLVPLNLENRRIVRKGLQAIRNNPRPAIAEILSIAQIEPSMLQEEHIGFQIAPRMNALGRLADANDIVPFFLSNDAVEIRITANRLDGLNLQRKQLCDTVFRAADDVIRRDPSLLQNPVLVLHHPTWPGGINGLVASQLTERYHKPSIVLTAPPEQNARGSARSIEGINITDAIASQEKLLSSFGGHSMAAGLSLPQENLEAFRKGISDYVTEISAGVDITAKTFITLETLFSSLTLDAFEKLELFSPFGPENPAPIYLTRNIVIKNIIALSKEKQHLKLECLDKVGSECTLFWWNGDEKLIQKETMLDVLYTARPTSFRGKISIQCTLLDFQIPLEKGIVTRRKEIQVIDRRQYPLSSQWLSEFAKTENQIAWAEGKLRYSDMVVNRENLHKAEVLLLASIPHSFTLLQKIVNQVHPRKIIFAQEYSESLNPEPLRILCAGLLKYAVNQKNGLISMSVFEIQTGEKPETIKTLLSILEAQGLYIIDSTDPENIKVQMPGNNNIDRLTELTIQLIAHKKETTAFRKYLKTVPVAVLSEMINI
jgi:single-stranded-DNA-specific exonuclease